MSNQLSDYLLQVIFAIQGTVIAFSNCLLFFTIIFKKPLRIRREMLLIAGMAAVDFIYGFGTFMLGLYRIIVMLYGVDSNPATSWSCAILPPVFVLFVGLQLTVVMSTIISIDRFIAVAYPVKYRLLTLSNAKMILGFVGILGVIFFLSILGNAYFFPRPSGTTRLCGEEVFSVNFNLYLYTFVSFVGGLSVLIYIGVFFAYQKKIRKIAHITNQPNEQNQTDRRLTVTLGIISLSTLILFTAPYTLFAVTTWINVPAPQVYLLFNLVRISTFINVVIFIQRQQEIRQGMWNLIRCKKL